MMMPSKQIYLLTFGLFFLCLPAGLVWAQQEVSFVAEAPEKAGLTDQIEVTYTIRNAENLRSLTPGKFNDFQIVAGPFQSQSTNLSINNGHRVQTQTISLTYILKPKRTGRLQIPAAQARDADNNIFSSNRLSLQVVPGSLAGAPAAQSRDPFADDPFARMQPNRQQLQQQKQAASGANEKIDQRQLKDDLFMKVEVDRTNVHAGEQITASYKLYTRLPMQLSISRLPSLNGFWTQDFDIPATPKPTEEIINGKKYQVFLIKKSALFPQQTGTLTLDAAETSSFARILQKVKQHNPFAEMFDDDPFFRQAFGGTLSMSDPFFNEDFFSSYAYQDVPVQLKSTPVRIQVKPLPTPRPESFDGAVGQYQLKADWDKTHFTTDDQTTLTLTITGAGNLKLFAPPILQLPNGLVAYDPKITDTITGRSTTISGRKIIQYTVTAHQPGSYTIPPLDFSYFDPKAGRYVALNTPPANLQIAPGAGVITGGDSASRASGSGSGGITEWLRQPWTWPLTALPLIAIGFLVFSRRKKVRHFGEQAPENASLQATRRLASAQQYLKQNEPTPFYTEISKAVWMYLSQRLDIPLARLSRQTAFQALAQAKVPESLTAQLLEVIDECEFALYTPGAGLQHMQQTFQQATAIINQLESCPGFSQKARAAMPA